MKQILLAALLAPSLLADTGGSEDPEKVQQSQQLTVRVYNYAGVENGVLGRAKGGASRIFAQLDIRTDWLDCPTSPEQIATNRACSAKPGPDHLILKLLPKAMSRKYGFKRDIFGFALPTADGAPGNDVSLFYARVLDLAYNGGVGTSFDHAKAIILGHMIAHEVGHLLLGPDSHGSSGVMSFPWNKRTLTTMERGLLEFTATERSTTHKELQRRADLMQSSEGRSWGDPGQPKDRAPLTPPRQIAIGRRLPERLDWNALDMPSRPSGQTRNSLLRRRSPYPRAAAGGLSAVAMVSSAVTAVLGPDLSCFQCVGKFCGWSAVLLGVV